MRGLQLSRFGLMIFLLGGWIVANPSLLAKEPKMKDLADTVLSNRILTKFAILLRASDQASFLSSRGPFTLFAPTDSAFSKIPPETFAALQRPENKEVLQRMILFCIVNGQRLTAKDLMPLKTVLTCEGNPLPLRVNRMGYQVVLRAKIIHADMRCLNGLIHEIDNVLLPPGVSLAALAAAPVQAATNSVSEPSPPTNDVPAAALTPVESEKTNSSPLVVPPPATP